MDEWIQQSVKQANYLKFKHFSNLENTTLKLKDFQHLYEPGQNDDADEVREEKLEEEEEREKYSRVTCERWSPIKKNLQHWKEFLLNRHRINFDRRNKYIKQWETAPKLQLTCFSIREVQTK